jgi:cellulose synthase (UDP-forming)
VNQNFVQALSLSEPNKKLTATDLLKLPVLDNNLSLRKDVLFVPPYQVGERNQLQLHYYFELIKEGECRDTIPDNLQAAIDPDSTLDFSSFPHYAALPNLAFFANIGFPYTRMADLSETAVILPDRPDANEISSYLMVMGRMGEATGYPVLRHQVITAAQKETVADYDLIIIGSGQNQPLMDTWADQWPMVQIKGERRVRQPDVFRRALFRWEENDVQPTPRPNGIINLRGGSNITTLMSIESPLSSKRTAVFLYADKAADLDKIGAAMRNTELVPQVQGDFVVFDDALISNALVGNTYYVGSLPLLHHLSWFFSNHPIFIGLMVLFISLLLATFAYRVLRRVAAKRLANKG